MARIRAASAEDITPARARTEVPPPDRRSVLRPHFGRSLLILAACTVIAALSAPARATQFLDDFEGDGTVSRIPAASLRNWDIVTSVDLYARDTAPPLCHLSGTCVDLVGTAGAKTGGIVSKRSFPLGDYVVGFFLYGSSRDRAGGGVASGGVPGRIQVSFGGRSIYANYHVASDFNRFLVLHVRGAGKLKILGSGAVADIGPLVDNVLVVPAGD